MAVPPPTNSSKLLKIWRFSQGLRAPPEWDCPARTPAVSTRSARLMQGRVSVARVPTADPRAYSFRTQHIGNPSGGRQHFRARRRARRQGRKRHPAHLHHRRDEAQLPRLRHERDRLARAARHPRRPEARAPAHPVRHARAGARPQQEVRQERPRRRRGDGQVPPARQPADLRRAGAHGAGFLHAPAAGRRPGQLRLGRRRSAGGRALHGMPADQGGGHAARRPRQEHGRVPRELRRLAARSRRSCRPSFRTCWSTARAASPSAWPPTFPRTTWAR